MPRTPSRKAKREYVGTNVERWLFDEDVKGLRCVWPTADLARRLMDQSRGEIRAILNAYAWLIDCPLDDEMIQRLKDLRKAEREGGYGYGTSTESTGDLVDGPDGRDALSASTSASTDG